MAELKNGQTCLESHGITERNNEIVRNDYNFEENYTSTHKDALSDGDSKGKGSGHGGHTDWLPSCSDENTKNMIDYRNFDTSPDSKIGDCYDINGRNGIGGRLAAMTKSLYNYQNPYGAHLINTEQNQNDGQIVVGYKQKIPGC